MKDAGDKHGLKTLTEVMDSAHCELVHSYVDGLQVGARNFQNFSLLKKIGQVTAESHKMVLYKRGFAGTIAEWLAATDYLTAEGNDNVVLCERGIRTFETATRFTLDIAAVPVIHKQSLYPVCIDVSHPAGQRDLVPSLAYAAVAAGRRLHHDRGASQPARGPLRRPAAADARPVRGAGRASCARSPPSSARRSCKPADPPFCRMAGSADVLITFRRPCRPSDWPDAAKPPVTPSRPLCAFPRVQSALGRAAGQSEAPGGFSPTRIPHPAPIVASKVRLGKRGALSEATMCMPACLRAPRAGTLSRLLLKLRPKILLYLRKQILIPKVVDSLSYKTHPMRPLKYVRWPTCAQPPMCEAAPKGLGPGVARLRSGRGSRVAEIAAAPKAALQAEACPRAREEHS